MNTVQDVLHGHRLKAYIYTGLNLISCQNRIRDPPRLGAGTYLIGSGMSPSKFSNKSLCNIERQVDICAVKW